MKITLSLTDQNVEWIHAEAQRRGLAVSDVLRRVIDEVSSRTVLRSGDEAISVNATPATRYRDAVYVLNTFLEVPNPEAEDGLLFKNPTHATVAEATLAFERLQQEIQDIARRMNSLDTLLTMAKHYGLGPDSTLEAVTESAETH